MTKNTSKTIKMTQNTPKSLKDKNTLKDLQLSKEYWSFQRFEYIFLFILQVFGYFGQFRGFVSIFGQLRFQGYFVHFLDFGGILVVLKFFWSFQSILGHIGHFSASRCIFYSFQMGAFWSFTRYRDLRIHFNCFGHLRGFGVILVILEIWGLFWSIKRFRFCFVLFFCFYFCLFVLFIYFIYLLLLFFIFCGFGGILVIFVILGVYWPFQ